jgi:hypothetical protein
LTSGNNVTSLFDFNNDEGDNEDETNFRHFVEENSGKLQSIASIHFFTVKEKERIFAAAFHHR